MESVKELKERVKHLKVLFVDDEEDVREGNGIFLRKFFDDVTVCSDGQDGYDEFKQQEGFDVVITDIKMPIMNGVEMVKKIKELDSNVFTVFLTASNSLLAGQEKIADLCFQKPLSFEDMIEVLSNLEVVKCQH